MSKEVIIEGLAGSPSTTLKMTFAPGWSIGASGSDSFPGVHFDAVVGGALGPDKRIITGPLTIGLGVITRTDAKRLADALNEFLAAHPPVTP